MTVTSSLPVTAGIDGSAPSLDAARWAAEEAESRRVPLRLVYVTTKSTTTAEAYAQDVRRGHAVLREAVAEIAKDRLRRVDTAVVDGPPTQALVAESEQAQIICVGSVGIGHYARSILGSTAADLAERACCPVAVIRPEPTTAAEGAVSWIVVGVTERPGNGTVVEAALDEATLRRLPVLALGDIGDTDVFADKLSLWRQRYPDVNIYPITEGSAVADFLRTHDARVVLAVIGAGEAARLADIVGQGHWPTRHCGHSALVVR